MVLVQYVEDGDNQIAQPIVIGVSVQSWAVLGVGIEVDVLPPPRACIPTAGGEEKNDTKSKNYGQA